MSCLEKHVEYLTTETVKGFSLAFQCVYNVHGGDSLPPGVFRVGNSVPDDGLQEDLEHTSGLLVDQTGDPLDTTPSGETSDRGLGDTLDVVAKHLPVPLGAALAEPLASLSASRHC